MRTPFVKIEVDHDMLGRLTQKFAVRMFKELGLEDVPGVTVDGVEQFLTELAEVILGEERQQAPTVEAIIQKLSPEERETQPWRSVIRWARDERNRRRR